MEKIVREMAYGSGSPRPKELISAIVERSTLPRDRLSPASPTTPPICARSDVPVIRAQHLLKNSHRARIQRLRFVLVALH